MQKTKIMVSGPIISWQIDGFLEFSCFFNDSMDVGNLISGFSVFSKYSLYIWKFSIQVLLKAVMTENGRQAQKLFQPSVSHDVHCIEVK